jgi:peptidoglycan/xylan/chitin deacetylase (PgdA/CDA1 family)
MLLTWLLNRLSPSGPLGRLTVVIFHRVLARRDDVFPEEMYSESFEQRIRWLKRWFNVLPMSQAIHALREGNLPERAALVTFDDGYADNYEIATPILQRNDCPATVFVAAGFLDGGRMWNDTVIEALRRSPLQRIDLRDIGLDVYPLSTPLQRSVAIAAVLNGLKYLLSAERMSAAQKLAETSKASLPNDLMLTSEQLKRMARAGITIGAHTMTHPILTRLDVREARQEIASGREVLRNLTQQPVEFFAYPNGRPGQDYSTQHVQLVRDLGFEAAFSTAWGSAASEQDLFQIPRLSPWGRTSTRFALCLAQNLRRNPSVAM